MHTHPPHVVHILRSGCCYNSPRKPDDVLSGSAYLRTPPSPPPWDEITLVTSRTGVHSILLSVPARITSLKKIRIGYWAARISILALQPPPPPTILSLSLSLPCPTGLEHGEAPFFFFFCLHARELVGVGGKGVWKKGPDAWKIFHKKTIKMQKGGKIHLSMPVPPTTLPFLSFLYKKEMKKRRKIYMKIGRWGGNNVSPTFPRSFIRKGKKSKPGEKVFLLGVGVVC